MDFIKQLASFRLGVKEKIYEFKNQRNLFKPCGIDPYDVCCWVQVTYMPILNSIFLISPFNFDSKQLFWYAIHFALFIFLFQKHKSPLCKVYCLTS